MDQQRSPWPPPGSSGSVPGEAPAGTSPQPPPRGPGWGGTLAAAVLAAVLAAGGTATAFTVLDDDASPQSAAAGAAEQDGAGGQDGAAADPDAGAGAVGDLAAPAPGQAVDWSQVAQSVAPSVVSIGVRSQAGAGQGSGVVIDAEGLVLTNNHVVAGAGASGQVQVGLHDGRVLAAEVLGTDPSTDLAVLRLADVPEDLQPLAFGDSDEVGVGQPVMALGNPLGLSHTVTTGIVSAVDRPVTTQAQSSSPFEPGVPVVTNAIQTDAAVNPGNSGGALVDAAGRLVGINSSIATTGSTAGGPSGSIGLGFAIPANQARWVADHLIQDGTVEHAYLGVALDEAFVEADGARREAAAIVEVVDGTPAAEAGLSAGEAVLAVDGEPVVGAESLVAQVREREPGTEVTLTVADAGGDVREVPVVFGERPRG